MALYVLCIHGSVCTYVVGDWGKARRVMEKLANPERVRGFGLH